MDKREKLQAAWNLQEAEVDIDLKDFDAEAAVRKQELDEEREMAALKALDDPLSNEALLADVNMKPRKKELAYKNGQHDEDVEQMKIDPNYVPPLRITLVGRPNVGKSTLINSLVGTRRVLTSSVEGTTTDVVELQTFYGKTRVLLRDTAGIVRRSRWQDGLDEVMQKASRKAILESHVVVMVINGSKSFSKADMALANQIIDAGRCLVVVANKWDLVNSNEQAELVEDIERVINDHMTQAAGVSCVVTSGLHGKNMKLFLDKTIDAYNRWMTWIPTAKLNRFYDALMRTVDIQHSVPTIRYITQAATGPPTFVVYISSRKEFLHLPDHFKNFLLKNIRKEFKLTGVPLRLLVRSTDAGHALNDPERRKELRSRKDAKFRTNNRRPFKRASALPH